MSGETEKQVSGWTVDTLKEFMLKLFSEKDKADQQRFHAQETALQKAEENRDTAINKAEASIEKKSDAVYVKVTDLQVELSKVMLRPEIEGRFKNIQEKLEGRKEYQDQHTGRGLGMKDLWLIITGIIALYFMLKSNGAL